jgi:hypothetical protein
MHGSPPCTITVERFRAWRAAVAVVAAAALAALGAWLFASPLGETPLARVGVAFAALVTVGLAASLWRQPTVRLRWDGLAWTVATPGAAAEEVAGRLEPAIDLGSFLLLRFHPAGRPGTVGARWIPVGRAGLEREWHGFRCAVHSPQPASGRPSAAQPPRT